MGDRANIYLTNGKYGQTDTVNGIYIYTHWGGHGFPEALREALKFGESRWNDPQYLQKIIIDQVLQSERDSETGAGISLEIGDNQYMIIVVDVSENVVAFAEPGRETDRDAWVNPMSFREYVAQLHAAYPPED